MMKLFRFRGGVHPAPQKDKTSTMAIEALPLPKHFYIPLQQHIGAPAEPQVHIGDKVLKGQLLAHSQGLVSAPVHAPTSGTIKNIIEFTAPHPSGLPVMTIELEADGQDKWIDAVVPFDPFTLTGAEISKRVGQAGVVGMGGATFPSAIKLSLGETHKLDTLLINGAECEPFLTCDDRLMQEKPEEVIDGARIMAHALGVKQVFIAMEDNKPAAFASLNKAASEFAEITVVKVPTLYPMGSEKQLVKYITGRETPAGKMAADIGVVMHNVATAAAVHHAIRFGRPLISRIVTVSGGAVLQAKNLEVRIGTLASELLSYCGLSQDPQRLLMGGPMMGNALPSSQVPITKGSNGILALSSAQAKQQEAQPCIRCGRCVNVCPIGLMPLEMSARIKTHNVSGAVDIGLMDCISCGSCSYVCPSHIPLVQYFNYAKGELKDQQAAKKKTEYTKKLAEAKTAREEAIKKAKAEAAALRKAEREAKAKAKKEAAAKKAAEAKKESST